MNITFKHNTNKTIELHRRGFHQALNIEPGTTIVCEKGLIWLTQQEDLKDYMLKAGEKLVINKSNVLIEALSESGLSIIYPN